MAPPSSRCAARGVWAKRRSAPSVAALLAEDAAKKVLAIDADPAVGLAMALGFPAKRTVDDIRNDLISKVKEGVREDMRQLASALDYEVFARP